VRARGRWAFLSSFIGMHACFAVGGSVGRLRRIPQRGPRLSGKSALRKNRLRRSIRWGLVSVCLCTMISSTTAGTFTRGCAARDLQILMWIEERENTNTIPAEKLSDAMLAMLEARMVCYEGRVMDAMALYDSISRSITADSVPSAGSR
jgi:hypothetical protein